MTQAPATSTTENTPQWSELYRKALAKRARWWMKQGAVVLPVIPMQLPADRWPKINTKTGKPTIKDGKPAPKFPGKAPSHWDRRTGEPVLIQRNAIAKGTRKAPSQEEVLRALEEPVTTGAAAEFGYPIGFCILTGPDLVVIDLDQTERNGELLHRASSDQHYIEQTPSGGLHLVVSPDDDMRSWAKTTAKGGTSYYTQWSLEPDGEHCGEVLCVGKVCVMAPTMRGDGKVYAPMLSFDSSSHEQEFTGTWENSVLTVPSITEAFDIHPTASSAKKQRKPKQEPTKEKTTSRQSTAKQKVKVVPRLQDLVGIKAQGLLQGDLSAYGDAGDRSATLTGFMREVQGTENWLIRDGLEFEQTAQELWELAVDALSTLDSEHEESIEEKAPRILETIDLEGCDVRDEAARRSRYNYLAKGSPQPFSKGNDQGSTRSHNPCDAQASAAAGEQERPPFVLRVMTPIT